MSKMIMLHQSAASVLPEYLYNQLMTAGVLYMLDEPNRNGNVFIGTTPSGHGGIATYVNERHITICG